MTSNFKRLACELLQTALETIIPSMAGRTEIGFADPEQKMKHPWIQILPHRFTFVPWQAGVVNDEPVFLDGPDIEMPLEAPTLDPDAIFDVGSWDGTIELRAVASSKPARERLEAQIMNAFFQNVYSPSVLVATASSYSFETASGTVVKTVDCPASFELMNDDWRDEMAWDKHRFSFIEVDVQIPMYVLVQNVGDILTLTLTLAAGNADEIVLTRSPDLDPPQLVESINIDENGDVA